MSNAIDDIAVQWANLIESPKSYTVEKRMALGEYLVVLKEALVYGEFTPRLKQLNITYTTANRLMSIARRFSTATTPRLLKTVRTYQKLVEMLALDDEEIVALEEGGTVRGLTLRDVARMSSKKLPIVFRENKASKVTGSQLSTVKSAKVDQLSHPIATATPQEAQKPILQGAQVPLSLILAQALEQAQAQALTEDEDRLLRHYRQCTAEGKAHVTQTAELLAGVSKSVVAA